MLICTDDVDGWYDPWTRHYIPYVGGCLRGGFQNRQLDIFRIQLIPDFAIHVCLLYDESWYSGNYINRYLVQCINFFIRNCMKVFYVAVAGGTDIINSICNDNDGCNSRYCASIRRGRDRFSISHILDSTLEFILYSSLFTSTRIFLCSTRPNLFTLNSIYVLASNSVFHHKLERRIVGNSWSANEENQEG